MLQFSGKGLIWPDRIFWCQQSVINHYSEYERDENRDDGFLKVSVVGHILLLLPFGSKIEDAAKK